MKSLKHAGEFGSVHFSRLNCLRTGEYLLERSWVLQACLHPGWALAAWFQTGHNPCLWSQLKAALAAQRLCMVHTFAVSLLFQSTTSFPYSPLWIVLMPSKIIIFCRKYPRSILPLFLNFFYYFFPQKGYNSHFQLTPNIVILFLWTFPSVRFLIQWSNQNHCNIYLFFLSLASPQLLFSPITLLAAAELWSQLNY